MALGKRRCSSQSLKAVQLSQIQTIMTDQSDSRRRKSEAVDSKCNNNPTTKDTVIPTIIVSNSISTLESISARSAMIIQSIPAKYRPAEARDPLDLILKYACMGRFPNLTAVVYPRTALKRLEDHEIDFRKALPGIGLINVNLDLSRSSSRQLLCQHKWRLSLDRSSPKLLGHSMQFFKHFALCFRAIELNFSPTEDLDAADLDKLRDNFRGTSAAKSSRRETDAQVFEHLALDGKQELYKRYIQRLEIMLLMTNVRYLTINLSNLGFAIPDWTIKELQALSPAERKLYDVRAIAYESLLAAIETTGCWRLWYPRDGFVTNFKLDGLKKSEKVDDDIWGTWAKVTYSIKGKGTESR